MHNSFKYRKQFLRVIDGVVLFQRAYRKYKYDKRFVKSERNELNRIQARQREYLSRFEPYNDPSDPVSIHL